jgi:hypothetical protein
LLRFAEREIKKIPCKAADSSKLTHDIRASGRINFQQANPETSASYCSWTDRELDGLTDNMRHTSVIFWQIAYHSCTSVITSWQMMKFRSPMEKLLLVMSLAELPEHPVWEVIGKLRFLAMMSGTK